VSAPKVIWPRLPKRSEIKSRNGEAELGVNGFRKVTVHSVMPDVGKRQEQRIVNLRHQFVKIGLFDIKTPALAPDDAAGVISLDQQGGFPVAMGR
jgi:hypothetical protein